MSSSSVGAANYFYAEEQCTYVTMPNPHDVRAMRSPAQFIQRLTMAVYKTRKSRPSISISTNQRSEEYERPRAIEGSDKLTVSEDNPLLLIFNPLLIHSVRWRRNFIHLLRFDQLVFGGIREEEVFSLSCIILYG